MKILHLFIILLILLNSRLLILYLFNEMFFERLIYHQLLWNYLCRLCLLCSFYIVLNEILFQNILNVSLFSQLRILLLKLHESLQWQIVILFWYLFTQLELFLILRVDPRLHSQQFFIFIQFLLLLYFLVIDRHDPRYSKGIIISVDVKILITVESWNLVLLVHVDQTVDRINAIISCSAVARFCGGCMFCFMSLRRRAIDDFGFVIWVFCLFTNLIRLLTYTLFASSALFWFESGD